MPSRSGWIGFALGVALTLACAVAVTVVVSHLRDRDVTVRCHGADARMTLSTGPGGGNIATVTVIDDERRDWEIGDEYWGSQSEPLPAIEYFGPGYYGSIRSVSDADDGYTKVLRVRPAGTKRWCALEARIGFGY